MVCFVVFGGFGGPGGGFGGPGGGLNCNRSSGKPLLLLRFKKQPPGPLKPPPGPPKPPLGPVLSRKLRPYLDYLGF